MSDELMNRASALAGKLLGVALSIPADHRGWFEHPTLEGGIPHNACTDAADAISDLLAEIERLQSDCTRIAIENMDHRMQAESAEAKLRELASAEPDGYAVTEAAGFTACFHDYADAYEHAQEAGGRPIRALIRRPEMPS